MIQASGVLIPFARAALDTKCGDGVVAGGAPGWAAPLEGRIGVAGDVRLARRRAGR